MNGLRTAFFIAYKSIRRGYKGTFVLLMIILCLSFFSTLFIPGIFSGLLNSIINIEVNTYTSHVVLSPREEPTPRGFISDQAKVRATIETIPGVTGTAREYLTAASLSFDKERNGVFKTVSGQVIGLDPSESKRILTLDNYVVAGQFLSDDDTDGILVSAALAGGYGISLPNNLGGVLVGDKVRVVYGNGVTRTYTVKGITNIMFGPAFTSVYITAKEAESVLGASNQASQILVRIDDQARVPYFKERIQTLAPSLVVRTYEDLITSIQSLIDAFKLIATIVSVISIMVAAITIFVITYINVVNKRRQIGILKAIGIKENIIVLSYIFQSLFYVTCGVLFGCVFVFFIIAPFLQVHPIMLPFGALSLSIGPSLVVLCSIGFAIAGLFAGGIPAHFVAREKILKAIWG